jgi:hypothetical protein
MCLGYDSAHALDTNDPDTAIEQKYRLKQILVLRIAQIQYLFFFFSFSKALALT